MLKSPTSSWLCLLVLALFALSATESRADPLIRFVVEDYRPLAWSDRGEAAGPAVELVAAAAAMVGWNHRFEVLPWSRGLNIVDNEKSACIFGMARTEEREGKYLWAGPLAYGGIGLYAARDLGPVGSVEEINSRGLRIGVRVNDVSEQVSRKLGFEHIVLVERESSMAKMLIAGRFDLWAGGRPSSLEVLRAEGVTEPREVLTLLRSDIYVACNPKTDRRFVEALKTSIQELTRTGKRDEIFERHRRLEKNAPGG